MKETDQLKKLMEAVVCENNAMYDVNVTTDAEGNKNVELVSDRHVVAVIEYGTWLHLVTKVRTDVRGESPKWEIPTRR